MLESLGLAALAAATGGTALTLAWRDRGAGKERRTARATYLDRCQTLFDTPLMGRAPTGFARLSGTYQNRTFDIQALPDTLTFRKLPCLWLLVTIAEPMPVSSTIDIMLRPTGSETFSNFGSLPVHLDPIPGLPPEAAIRTDDPDGLPPASVLQENLGLFASDRVKELVISPKGLRITFLAEEANRARYLLYRDAELGMTPLSQESLRPLLDQLVRLAATIDAASGKESLR
ncbi:MAG: hypothetical protein WBA91_02335 [Paracoccaceae bacterium]